MWVHVRWLLALGSAHNFTGSGTGGGNCNPVIASNSSKQPDDIAPQRKKRHVEEGSEKAQSSSQDGSGNDIID